MQSTWTYLLLTGAALLSPGLCQGKKQASVIRLPECAANGHGTAKSIDEASASSCQAALLTLYGRGNELFTPSGGCQSLASVSSCDVYICTGVNNGVGTISAGVIATAAQDIHSHCRLNGKVGGRVFVSDPDNNHANSVLIQLGFLNKDELRVRSSENHVELDKRSEGPPLSSTLSARRVRRDEDKGLAKAPGVNEGESVQLNVVEIEDLTMSFYNELIRVRDNEPNENWRNTAQVRRDYHNEHGLFSVVMAFLGRDGQTVNSLGRADQDLDDLIQKAAGEWIAGGQRTIFSEHLYRRIVPDESTDERHQEIGEMAIAAVIQDAEGDRSPRSSWFNDLSLGAAAGVFIGTSNNSDGPSDNNAADNVGTPPRA